MTMFRVVMTVPSKELGEVLAKNVDYQPEASLIVDVPHNKNKPKAATKPKNPNRDYKAIGSKAKINRGKVTEALVKLMEDAPNRTVTLVDAKRKLNELGFAGEGVYGLRTRLVNQKLITARGNEMTLVKA